MLTRQYYIALGLVFSLVVVILAVPAPWSAQLKTVVGGFFLPLFGLAALSQSAAESSEPYLLPKRAVAAELQKLRQENERLRIQQMQMEQVLKENQQLRQAVEWQKQVSWEPKLGRVIMRDPATWWRTVQINLGARDGVKANMPVLTSAGLVGRISHAGYSSSQVVLLGDPNCQVSAEVEETRDHGVIISGASLLDPSIVVLSHLNRQSSLRPGQRVVTSGLGEIFPRGIRIGDVLDVTSVGYGIYMEARIKLAADLNQLDHVWVLP
jgi:rod shape-determining protein MreC